MHNSQSDPVEAEIDALIAEFGSPRVAMRALLHDLTILADDMNASTSRGYTRGKVVEIRSFRQRTQLSQSTSVVIKNYG